MSLIGYTSRDPFYVPEKMADAIAARALGGPIPADLRPYAGTSFATLAHACLVAVGADPHGVSPSSAPGALIALALTATDFPKLVGAVFERVVMSRYRKASPTYSRLTKPVEVSHFKTTPVIYPGDFPALLEVPESGEVQQGAIREAAEQVTLKLYARTASLSLRLLTDDDTNALSSLAEAAASRFVDHANALFHSTCLAPNAGLGPTLLDAATFFHSTHSNTVGAVTLSLDSIGVARALLKAQTTLDGVAPNADAAFLLVPPSLQTRGEELVHTLQGAAPDGQRLEVLSDAALTGVRWYLFARPSEVPSFAHVSTSTTPSVVTQKGFTHLGVDVRISAAHAFAPLDYRGAVTCAGA